VTRVAGAKAYLLRASPKSQWVLAEITTDDGLCGYGEASLHFSVAEVCASTRMHGDAVRGLTPEDGLVRLAAMAEDNLVHISARCAIDQALHDIVAQRAGRPIAAMFGRKPAESLEVYANINRRTVDRSPDGFAASAHDAVKAGFSALKIAPFDGLSPTLADAEAAPLIAAGIARMAAVREAIGSRRMLVDCHWRLAPQWLDAVVSACAGLDVFWLETPYPEELDRIGDIHRARRAANRKGVMLAGCELKTGQDGFRPFIAGGCYDVLMPDMKYVGGYADYMSVAEAAAMCGVRVSPHNPTGPICHAHSVQASAATEDFLILEMQFDETPAFAAIVEGDLPLPTDGRLNVPREPGLGVRLAADRLALLLDAA
jgi:galactonate dehydratase